MLRLDGRYFESSSHDEYFPVSIWTHQPKLRAAKPAARREKRSSIVVIQKYRTKNIRISSNFLVLGFASCAKYMLACKFALTLFPSFPKRCKSILPDGPLDLQPQYLAPAPFFDRIHEVLEPEQSCGMQCADWPRLEEQTRLCTIMPATQTYC